MSNDGQKINPVSPLLQVEAFCDELEKHYGNAQDKEIRAAAKLLLVALDRFSRSDNSNWETLVDEYVAMAKYDRDKFINVLNSNRGKSFLA